MGTLYTNRINATTSSWVTVDAHLRVSGSMEVTGTLNAKVTDFVVSANSTTLGDASSDTVTINAGTVSIPNNLNFDSNTLFLDASNNRVGVGTASPSEKVDVSLTGANGGIRVINATDNVYLKLDAPSDEAAYIDFSTSGSNDWQIGRRPGSNDLTVYDNDGASNYIFTWQQGGNVGVGTLVPTHTLSVTGTLGVSGSATFENNVQIKGLLYGGSPVEVSGGFSVTSGDFIVDTTTLKVDSTNNRVGIGTAVPEHTLSVSGTLGVTNQLTVHDTTTTSANAGSKIRLSANDGAPMGDSHRLGVVEFTGAEDSSGTQVVGARIEALTDAAWTNAENGCALYFYTTDGNASQSNVLKLDSNQKATFSADVTVGDDVILNSDGAVIHFGANSEVTLTHEHDAGLILAHTGSGDPVFTIENTNADATGGTLKFKKDGASPATSDVIGNIDFASEDAGNAATTYARIQSTIVDVTAGGEQGGLSFLVAENDGTLTEGLAIDGLASDGNITVDVATHDGSAGGLKLGGTLVTATASELNILDGKSFVDEDGMDSNSATAIASQQSIKAYVDAQVTASDLDFQGDSGGALSIDLDSETLDIAGGTGITTVGSSNTLTVNVDASQAGITTLAGLTAAGTDGADLALTYDTVTITDDEAGEPQLIIKTTNTTGSVSGELKFLKDAADTEDGEVLGQITFYGEDEGNNSTQFAGIKASISESDETDEAGTLELQVAESDGTNTAMTTGLKLEGEHATDGQIDVTIAAGAASTTTVAGDLTVTGGDVTVGPDSDGTDRILTFGHSTLKSVIGIDDDQDVFAINTDAAFESTNDFEIDASGNVTIGNGSLTTSTNIAGGSSIASTTTVTVGTDLTVTGGDIVYGNGQDATLGITATAHGAAGKPLTISAGTTTAGTTNNIAGGSLTLSAGQGKGSGAGGDIVFKTANAGGSGSSLNSLATALTISDDLSATFAGSVVASAGITAGAAIVSDTDSTDDLGTSSVAWRKLYVDDIDLNGQGRIDLNVDGDTSIRVNAAIDNDIIVFEHAGTDCTTFSATGLKTWASGTDFVQWAAGSDGALTIKAVDANGNSANMNLTASGDIGFNAAKQSIRFDTMQGGSAVAGLNVNLSSAGASGYVALESATAGQDLRFNIGAGGLEFMKIDESARALLIANTGSLQFRDSAIHIASADDGHLDLTADTSIDLNGDVVVGSAAGSGNNVTFYGAGAAAHVGLVWDADGETEGVLYGGADDHGVDFKFFGETSGKFVEWDMSRDTLEVAGQLDVDGYVDIDSAASTGAAALSVTNSDTDQYALQVNGTNINQNLVGFAASALTTGDVLNVTSSGTDTSGRAVLNLTNTAAAAVGTAMIEMRQNVGSAAEATLIQAETGVYGSQIALKTKEVAMTLQTTGSVTTLHGALPANGIMISIGIRVTTAITGDAYITKVGFGVGGSVIDDDFFITTGGSLQDNILEQAGDTIIIPFQPATQQYSVPTVDSNLVITHADTPDAGAIRVAMYYWDITAPTS